MMLYTGPESELLKLQAYSQRQSAADHEQFLGRLTFQTKAPSLLH